MNISYNWLKEYINVDLEVNKLAEVLTDIGLEVGGIEMVQSIKGGLEGLVVGEVLTREQHPNADKLSKTTINIGAGEPLDIVCGAPNVAAGQKVVVATVGTTLYSGDESFVIKKTKIRGEVSLGMICAEDEIGVGNSHDGIMVLPANTPVGTLASDYFKVENDYVIEVDLTPNRVDAASHIGVARDIAAYLALNGNSQGVRYPDVSDFEVETTDYPVAVAVENTEACPRYCGVTISGIQVKESPAWLQNRLKAIGMSPINNIVDITNYVLHEMGQPLHAFDGDKITGDKITVKTVADQTAFTTLDEVERKLSDKDLMICNQNEGMCIAGVFGGLESGVTENTTKIFLESAYFNPVWVRKTAKRHTLSTDSSFRFERGVDPSNTLVALKRAAALICDVAGGHVSSEVTDLYPEAVAPFNVTLKLSHVTRLVGKDLGTETIKTILSALNIEIASENGDVLELKVPTYRVDVQREADVIEDILRIYGYNNIEVSDSVRSTITYSSKPDDHKLKNLIADQLVAAGFNEIMNNSLTKASFYNHLESYPADNTVMIHNPLSQDLNAMRQTLLFGGLETVIYNTNRKKSDLKLFEFGNCYFLDKKEKADGEEVLSGYSEAQHLLLVLSGRKAAENWNATNDEVSLYELKAHVENVLKRMAFNIGNLVCGTFENELVKGLTYLTKKGETLVSFGEVDFDTRKKFDIEAPVLVADFNWDVLINASVKNNVTFAGIAKYPEVRRDLALLIDKAVTFAELEAIAYKTERKLLREVGLFDVYEGKNLAEGKKSYALSFILRDDAKTLKDKQIDKVMNNLIRNYKEQVGAEIR